MAEEESGEKSHGCTVGTTGGGLVWDRACTNAKASRWLSWLRIGSVFTGILAKVQPASLDVTNHRKRAGHTGPTCNSLLRTLDGSPQASTHCKVLLLKNQFLLI